MIDDATEPLMPLLRALKRNKLKISFHGDSARVGARKDESRTVEANDLVSKYARGQLTLDALVNEVRGRLGERT